MGTMAETVDAFSCPQGPGAGLGAGTGSCSHMEARGAAHGGTCAQGTPMGQAQKHLALPKTPRLGQGPQMDFFVKQKLSHLHYKHILFYLIHSAR